MKLIESAALIERDDRGKADIEVRSKGASIAIRRIIAIESLTHLEGIR